MVGIPGLQAGEDVNASLPRCRPNVTRSTSASSGSGYRLLQIVFRPPPRFPNVVSRRREGPPVSLATHSSSTLLRDARGPLPPVAKDPEHAPRVLAPGYGYKPPATGVAVCVSLHSLAAQPAVDGTARMRNW